MSCLKQKSLRKDLWWPTCSCTTKPYLGDGKLGKNGGSGITKAFIHKLTSWYLCQSSGSKEQSQTVAIFAKRETESKVSIDETHLVWGQWSQNECKKLHTLYAVIYGDINTYDIIVYNCNIYIYTHLLPDTWGVFIGFGLGHEDMRWTPPRRSKMLPPTSRVSALCCWTCQQFRVPNTYDIEVRTPQLDPKT